MFIAALFITAKTCRHPSCPSASEQINCGMFQTIEYYSALKRNELQGHEKTRRKFKYILLSERSQPAETMYCMTPTI